MTTLEKITTGLRAATEAADLFARALEAANNDDQQQAERYLAQARSRYDAARERWSQGQSGRP